MSKKVICVNSDNLPPGANIKEGETYEVLEQFVNTADQCAYIIKGITNEGTTKYGFSWRGYRCERFANLEYDSVEVSELAYLHN